VLVLGLVALVLLGVLSMGIGAVELTPGRVMAALAPGADATDRQIVVGLRMPRALLAVLAGLMLALAGTLMQTITRNDLADPSLLGLSGGSALAIVALYAVLGGVVPAWATMVAGVLGAALVAILVLVMSRGSGDLGLLLYGVIVGAVVSAAVSAVLSLQGSLLGGVLRWVVGSLNARTWQDVLTLLPWALCGLALTVLVARAAVLLWAGDGTAASLGQDPRRARLWCLLAVVLLVAGACAAAGPMAFVGLVAPHLARVLVGTHPLRVLPVAAVLGALLLLGADALAQLAMQVPVPGRHAEGRSPLPTGAVTAIVGGPFLLFLLLKKGRG
jgi:iron complex transport system permease protein